MRIPSPDGQSIDVRADMVLVFIEGKVMAESFSVEPVLMNWLFRHSDFGNPLAGTVVSSIVGWNQTSCRAGTRLRSWSARGRSVASRLSLGWL